MFCAHGNRRLNERKTSAQKPGRFALKKSASETGWSNRIRGDVLFAYFFVFSHPQRMVLARLILLESLRLYPVILIFMGPAGGAM